MPDILTVAELRALLVDAPDDAVVMLECDDNYYSGPVSRRTSLEVAVQFGPGTYKGPSQDERGNRIEPQTYAYEGGWMLRDGRHDADLHVLAERPAFVIRDCT